MCSVVERKSTMLVMWYFEVKASRSDSEALSYARFIQHFFTKTISDFQVRCGRRQESFSSKRHVVRLMLRKRKKKYSKCTYGTRATIDAAFSKSVLALSLVD